MLKEFVSLVKVIPFYFAIILIDENPLISLICIWGPEILAVRIMFPINTLQIYRG